MNKIIKNTLILAAITVVSGLVLGAAYEVTKDPIAQTQAKQKQEACQAVYPEADSFEAMDVDQKAAKEAGCSDFISKPIVQSELKKMLNKWLSPELNNKIQE